jgi:hypothetical protein
MSFDKDGFYYFWRNGTWFMRHCDRGPNPEDVVLLVEDPKNKVVCDALEKLQQGIPADSETTKHLMEGILKWIEENRGGVVDQKQEEIFVKYVLNHMRQRN